MKLASLQIISDLQPIPGADKIEVATVLGYKTVVKKGEFKIGDQCIWHEPDTIVPDLPEYEFLRQHGFRLRAARFRGQFSQGLALPATALNNQLPIGADLTEMVGITKYEKPVPQSLAGQIKGHFPSWLIKTDEPNLCSFPEAFQEFVGLDVVVTLKIDGTSGTYYFKDGEFGVCSRNLDLLETADNSFWRIARQLGLEDKMRAQGLNRAIQGEVYGEGIQGNSLGIRGKGFAAFNLFDIDNHSYSLSTGWILHMGIPMVPIFYAGPFKWSTLQELVSLANAASYANGHAAEGLVIRPIIEKHSNVLESGRLSVKVVSEEYALKHGE